MKIDWSVTRERPRLCSVTDQKDHAFCMIVVKARTIIPISKTIWSGSSDVVNIDKGLYVRKNMVVLVNEKWQMGLLKTSKITRQVLWAFKAGIVESFISEDANGFFKSKAVLDKKYISKSEEEISWIPQLWPFGTQKVKSKRKLEERKLKEVKYMSNKGMRKSACEWVSEWVRSWSMRQLYI